MSKISLILLSLLAAIPSGVLATQMGMAFMKYGGGANLSFVILAATSLLIGGILALMPIGVMVFAPSSGAPAKSKSGQGAQTDDDTSLADEDDLEEVEDLDDDDDLVASDDEEILDDEELLADDDLLGDDLAEDDDLVEDWDDSEFDEDEED